MKFLADMGISPKTVVFLHSLGYDAVHLSEQGLERLPDPGIVEKARQEERIMLVHDLGFGELVAASGARLPSVITFRLRNMHPDRVNGALQSILPQQGLTQFDSRGKHTVMARKMWVYTPRSGGQKIPERRLYAGAWSTPSTLRRLHRGSTAVLLLHP